MEERRGHHDGHITYINAQELFELVSFHDAIDAVRSAAVHFEGDVWPRSVLDVRHGQFFQMPAQSRLGVGTKLATVAPANPERNLPRVHAAYVLFEPEALRVAAIIDGTALTTLRTPAVSAVAVDAVATQAARRVVIFGSGPQAWGHARALTTVRDLDDIAILSRSRATADALVKRLRREGIDARTGAPADVVDADIVVCATTAREPVFDGRMLSDEAVCVAVGSHEPEARELDDTTMRRARTIIVEHVETSLREAGDIIQAVDRGILDAGRLVALPDVVGQPNPKGISVFKSVGMGWQDLAVAELAARRHRAVARRSQADA